MGGICQAQAKGSAGLSGWSGAHLCCLLGAHENTRCILSSSKCFLQPVGSNQRLCNLRVWVWMRVAASCEHGTFMIAAAVNGCAAPKMSN